VDQDRFVELAPDYALGLLEGDDLEQFERHLAAGCEACELELARMDAVADALAYAGPPVLAPPALRDRVLAAVDADVAAAAAAPAPAPASAPTPAAAPVKAAPAAPAAPPPPADVPSMAATPARPPLQPTYAPGPWPPPRADSGRPVARPPQWWERLAPGLAFAAILATVLTGVYASKLKQELALVRADLERVQAENQELARVMDVVNAPRLRLIALGGQAASPRSEGRVLWSPESRKAVFYATNLPAPPAGKDYQLWIIAGQTPRSEGVFPVDEKGGARHVLPEVPAAGGVGAFAVTLEPAGGLPQPSGPMFLLGAVPAATTN